MFITLEEMEKLHAVQLEMFHELIRVMNELKIRYYFVHGSLLSAVTTHKFIDEDDDIDIAVFREDYERLVKDGNKIVSSKYFIQSSQNDDFPLSFGKFRNVETEFYQPILAKCDCNKGIYIDIFPIDFVLETESRILKLKHFLLRTRINSRLNIKRGLKQNCMLGIATLFYPSYRVAIKKREALYASCRASEYVSIFGGKPSERHMMYSWFGEGIVSEFCGIKVNCPSDSAAYLTRIYGEKYLEKNPAEERISADKMVEISASYVDFGGENTIGEK